MNKVFFIFCLCLISGITARGQKAVRRVNLDQNTIVKDSSGTVYPFVVWSKMASNGDCKFYAENPMDQNTAFILKFTTKQEKAEMMAKRPKPRPSLQFKIGDTFSPFKDKDLAGEKMDLKAMAGKVIVLNFWFIGCPPCRAEIPDLYNITKQYKDNKDVVFVSVGLDEGYAIKDFIKQNPLGYHLIDNGRYIAGKYGVHLYPTNVVIGRDGKIAYSSEGGSSTNPYWIQHTIDEALAASAISTASK